MMRSAEKLTQRLRSYEDIDIGDARALPMDMYTSEDLLERETEQIFRKE